MFGLNNHFIDPLRSVTNDISLNRSSHPSLSYREVLENVLRDNYLEAQSEKRLLSVFEALALAYYFNC
jgi:hypothetical protein